jgi:hypothetical protein
MEFRRITGLPPYVFTIIDSLKQQARRAGEDVIDLGFGNPDIPSPEIAVEKLAEAARVGRNHRYSQSKGIPKLRQAAADLYLRRFGVSLDPDLIYRARPWSRLLLEAADGSEDGRRKLRGKRLGNCEIVAAFDSRELDLALGRSNVIHAGLTDDPLSRKFVAAARKFETYSGTNEILNQV